MFYILSMCTNAPLGHVKVDWFVCNVLISIMPHHIFQQLTNIETSGYATWFTVGGAIRIAHYDVIDDLITRKL